MSSAQLMSATRQAMLDVMQQALHQTKPAAPSSPTTYTVQPGDSLWEIAGKVYHQQDAWPVLYWGNRGEIRWADDIQVGQVLQVPAEPATIPAPPAQLAPVQTTAAFTPKHASTAPVVAQSPPQAAPAPAPDRGPERACPGAAR